MKQRYVFTLLLLSIALVGYTQSESVSSLVEKAKKNDASAEQKLIGILESDESSLNRAEAARALGDLKSKAAVEQLLKSLDIDDDTVREDIIISLGKIGTPQGLDKVIAVWNNKSEKEAIRMTALESLGYFGPGRGVKVLVGAMELGISKYKNAAVQSLGMTKSPEAAMALVKLLGKEKANAQAAEALAKCKAKNSYPDIVNYLKGRTYDREFDKAFVILAELMGSEKYNKAQDILAKAYFLTGSYGGYEARSAVTKALKDIGVNSSYCMVTVNELRLRNEPNNRSDVAAKLMKNTFASVLEKSKIKHTIDDVQDYWYKVKTEKGETGWLFGAYLQTLDHKEFMAGK